MPVAFVIALVAIVLLLAVVRLAVPSLPLRPIAVSPSTRGAPDGRAMVSPPMSGRL